MLKLALIFLTIFCIPTSVIAQPTTSGEISIYPQIVLGDEVTHPVKPPVVVNKVLYNCWSYVRSRYPQTPPTRQILANLGPSGEIGVLYYPRQGLYHYVVVEKVDGDLIHFSETNYKKGTYSERTLDVSEFVGFYKL